MKSFVLRDTFVLKIQRRLCHPKCPEKFRDFPEKGPQAPVVDSPNILLKRSALHCGCVERLVGRVFVVPCFLTDSFYHFLGTSDISEVLLGLKKPVGFLLSWPVGEQFKRHSRDSTSGSSRSFPFYFLPSLVWCTSLHVI